MTLKRASFWTRQVILAVCGGILLAGGIFGLFRLVFFYVAPARNVTSLIALHNPIVNDYWIKIPADIDRDRECPASGTMTLRRTNDYGDVLGTRQDVITVGLSNSTVTGVGRFAVMLWFPRPEHLEPGSWSFDAKVADDCGGVGDLFNYSLANPRNVVIPNVLVVPGP